jgi:hypothetical protein
MLASMAKRTTTPPLDILGTNGITRDGGRVDKEFHRLLRGAQGRRRLKEMAENDPIIGTALNAITLFLKQAEITVSNPTGSSSGAELSEFVEECLGDMAAPFDDYKGDTARAVIVHGFTLAEIVLKLRNGDHNDIRRRSKYDDNRIGWRKWGPRPPETIQRWEFDDEGEVLGAYQAAKGSASSVFLPIERLLHFRSEAASGNPEGRSLLRSSFTSYHYAHNLRNVEAIGAERDLHGTLLIQAPAKIMASKSGSTEYTIRQAIEEMGSQYKRDERQFLLMPASEEGGQKTGWGAELMTAGGSGVDIDKIIRRHESRMAMPLLSEIMFLGIDGGQGLGGELGSVKLEMLERWIRGILGQFIAPINAHAIPQLMRLNGWTDRETYPKITIGPIRRADLAELAESLGKLVGAQVITPDRALEDFVRSEGGLPEAEDQEELSD